MAFNKCRNISGNIRAAVQLCNHWWVFNWSLTRFRPFGAMTCALYCCCAARIDGCSCVFVCVESKGQQNQSEQRCFSSNNQSHVTVSWGAADTGPLFLMRDVSPSSLWFDFTAGLSVPESASRPSVCVSQTPPASPVAEDPWPPARFCLSGNTGSSIAN